MYIVLRLVVHRFLYALDYHKYWLAVNASNCDDGVAKTVAKWAKRLWVQTNTNIFDSFPLTAVIGLVLTFQRAQGRKGFHEGSVI